MSSANQDDYHYLADEFKEHQARIMFPDDAPARRAPPQRVATETHIAAAVLDGRRLRITGRIHTQKVKQVDEGTQFDHANVYDHQAHGKIPLSATSCTQQDTA